MMLTLLIYNTRDSIPYSSRIVCGFFMNMGHFFETGPTIYSPYPNRFESLTIFR